MKLITLNQVSDENTMLNTLPVSSFLKKIEEFKFKIDEIGGTHSIHEYKNELEKTTQELSYFIDNTFVLSDNEYKDFEDSQMDDLF